MESKKRKPNRKSRNTSTEEKSVPQGVHEKKQEVKYENKDLKQRLRDKIKQCQKDRAKGSYTCEENANHEY